LVYYVIGPLFGGGDNAVNRAQLQQLAEERVRDAQALLNVGQWSGAYYLAGYAVECGLKACIAKLTNQYDYPNKDLAQKCYTHKIEVLIEVAGLELQRKADATANRTLGANWLIVKDWDERARYQQWTESQARKLYEAITDPANGVLPWIKVHW
jgi:HEPN domain-containing protein